MMHIDDIEEALGENDIRGIEGAFRALVDFPHGEEIEGAETVDVLEGLFHRVAIALEGDQSVMPAATRQVVQEVMSGQLDEEADYAAGATIVREHIGHWRALFLARMAREG